MKSLKIVIILFALLPLAQCAMANQDGDGTGETLLTGSVSDASSRKPVKGVTVSITSSKDKTGKCFTTDDSGRFIIPRLPAGEVTIILEKKGYKTYRREKIVIREGRQVKLNFDISNDNKKQAQGTNLFHPLLHMLQS